MVRIVRPAVVPRTLRIAGPHETANHITEFNADPAGFQTDRSFEFRSRIYGSKSVKRALTTCQSDKCCFCESKVGHISYGDVEHFRPKAGYKQNEDDPLTRPGYYWLAYEWTNLLFSCQICNQREKGNYFPLADNSKRATSTHSPLADEQPLFINPSLEDPENFIGFRGATPFPINNNIRGQATIDALGLKRKSLRERRSERLEMLKYVYLVARQTPANPAQQRAEALLQKASSTGSEYSVAVRSAIATGFRYV